VVNVESWLNAEVSKLEDNDETLSFKTYKNYLDGVSSIILKEYGAPNVYLLNLKEKLESIDKNINIQKDVDIEKIKSLLINSWHTELNFLLPLKISGDMSRYSLHWAPVQMYYSLYLAIRALFESARFEIKNTHEPTLKSISNWIVNRNLFPYPWTCYCEGLSELKNCKFNNFKSDIKEVCALSFPDDETSESFYAKFLKTTRNKYFDDKKFRAGLKTKGGKPLKSFSKANKQLIEQNLHKTTIFDCIYRLRIKSNYEEAETYILSEMSKSDADKFYNSLKIVLTSSLLTLEYLIVKHMGKERFKEIVESFERVKRTDLFTNESIFLRKLYLI